ncbi:MAG TPA: GNAT family N-acetyltransferase [Acidimicrobiales bacterium]|jgi:hypothetical protein
MPDITVADVPARSRYEIRVDGVVAGFATYRGEHGLRVMEHTEIDDAHEGQGLGGRLAAGVLDDVRKRGMRVRLDCPFMRGYVARHPEYQDLVGD